MRYLIIVWSNYGERTEYRAATLSAAEGAARACRTANNRTVKIADSGDSIRHWSRTIKSARNQWVRRATAECSR